MVDVTPDGGPGQLDRADQHRTIDVTISRPGINMVVPAPAQSIVEKDTLEAMIGPDRPIASTRQGRQRVTRKVQPLALQFLSLGSWRGLGFACRKLVSL